MLRATSIVALLVATTGCAEASVTLEFGAAPASFAYIFQSLCGVASDEAECRTGGPAPFSTTLEPNEAVEPGLCRMNMSITVACATNAPSSQLLQGVIEVEVHSTREPAEVTFDTFDRRFDDDGDAFSNYLEWASGTALNDAADVPADTTPDL